MIKTGKGPKAITSAKSIREANRRAEMLSLRLEGKTLEQIGAHMQVGADTVHRVISRALTSVTKEPAEELLSLEIGRCDLLLNEAMQTVKAFHPLVSGGRVVSEPILDDQGCPVRDAATGDVLTRVIADAAPKLAAIHVAVRVLERRAKLLGLDAATKLQQEVRVTNSQPECDFTRLSDDELKQLEDLVLKAATPLLPSQPQVTEIVE